MMDTQARLDAALAAPGSYEAKWRDQGACIAEARAGGLPRPLVFTNGVFDLLHRGHVACLEAAARLGATLVVALNTDASARRLGKGPDRPINTLADRAAVLAALACVDRVTCFDEDTPLAIIAALRPEYIVKGGDYDMSVLPETTLVQAWGGQALAIPFEFERSTTHLVERIRAGEPGGR